MAGGSKQISYEGYEKSEGSSPIARTDSVIMTGVIDAHKCRSVAVIDVENVFFSQKMIKESSWQFVVRLLSCW